MVGKTLASFSTDHHDILDVGLSGEQTGISHNLKDIDAIVVDFHDTLPCLANDRDGEIVDSDSD